MYTALPLASVPWTVKGYAPDQIKGAYGLSGSGLDGSGWLYGAGGGTSPVFSTPSYQQGLGLSGRGVPDVAALADPQTGFLVGQTQTFPDGAYYEEYRIGGTGLASPIFAGIMALTLKRDARTG